MTDTPAQNQQSDFLKKSKLLKSLAQISEILPIPLYWLNNNYEVMGANAMTLSGIGFPHPPENIIGVTASTLYPQELASKLIANEAEVYRDKKTIVAEEVIKNMTTGKIQIYTATLCPLFDKAGNMMGIIGTSIEITNLKEKEQLNLEREQNKLKLEFEKNITQAINQNTQDILFSLSRLLEKTSSLSHISDSDQVLKNPELSYQYFYNLTDRQQECAFFLIRGYTYKEIAKELNLQISTIQTHVEHIKVKFNLTYEPQSQLIKHMIKLGFMHLIPRSFSSISNKERIKLL